MRHNDALDSEGFRSRAHQDRCATVRWPNGSIAVVPVPPDTEPGLEMALTRAALEEWGAG